MVVANVRCPECGTASPFQLFRTIWAEEPRNRALLLNDEVNVFTCPHCSHREMLDFAVMVSNVPLEIAIWYEPQPDRQIDKDLAGYRAMYGSVGQASFYGRAPRIADWQAFKAKYLEMEAAASALAREPHGRIQESGAPGGGRTVTLNQHTTVEDLFRATLGRDSDAETAFVDRQKAELDAYVKGRERPAGWPLLPPYSLHKPKVSFVDRFFVLLLLVALLLAGIGWLCRLAGFPV